jgi:hypothetical protein
MVMDLEKLYKQLIPGYEYGNGFGSGNGYERGDGYGDGDGAFL